MYTLRFVVLIRITPTQFDEFGVDVVHASKDQIQPVPDVLVQIGELVLVCFLSSKT